MGFIKLRRKDGIELWLSKDHITAICIPVNESGRPEPYTNVFDSTETPWQVMESPETILSFLTD